MNPMTEQRAQRFFDPAALPADLRPRADVLALLASGWSAQQEGDREAALQAYAAAVDQAVQLDDQPGAARALGQLAALEEQMGRVEMALEHNRQAIDRFLAIGDGAGLVQAYRTHGFIRLRMGAVEKAAAALAQALGLALQLDTRLVATTLNQFIPMAHFLIDDDRLTDLLPLGAALIQAVQQVEQQRGEWPPEMADFAEIAATVGGVFTPLAVMADEPDLDQARRRKLAARATHQAWLVDALTRRRWGLADLVDETLQEKLDFHEKLD